VPRARRPAEILENPLPVRAQAEVKLRRFTDCAQEAGWEGYDQGSRHERVWKPETIIGDVAVRGDEKTDDNGESAHKV
jgi:hypothetical protein